MKRTLIAVCGLNPQVITETLFALYHRGDMVDKVRVLTTSEGKAACNAYLLAEAGGKYYEFLKDFGIDRKTIDFSSRHLLAVKDAKGRELHDIATEEDSEAFLNECMALAFKHTADPDSTVFFSIAGGRKTMGASLAVAAQFYGRPQDRVFHVMVSPEFEASPEFYYPPPKSRPLTLFDRQRQPFTKETKYAEVNLVPLPFVSVRDRISADMMSGPEEPSALLMSLVREKRHELMIDLPSRKICWRGVEADVMPAPLAIYAFFAMRKKSCAKGQDDCRECSDCWLETSEVLEHGQDIARIYDQITSGRHQEEMSHTGIQSLNQENFNSYKAKVNGVLRQAFGTYESPKLMIDASGKRPATRYGLGIDRNRIKIIM
jgi:CRISPR-associated protein Csx14